MKRLLGFKHGVLAKVLIMAITLGVSASAFAYVPPSAYILKAMAKKHSAMKTVRIRSLVTAMDGDKPTSVHFKETTLYNSQTGTLRCWASDDSDQKLYEISRPLVALSPAAQILFSSQAPQIAQALKTKGIPVKTEDDLGSLPDDEARRAAEVEELSRWKDQIAWVIGKADPNTPSFWVEKDSFFPVRLTYTGENGAMDIRFESFRYTHEFPYPRSIALAKKEVVVMRDDVQDVLVNIEPGSKLWGGRAETRGGSETSGFTDVGNSAASSIRELIRQYYDAIR